MLKQVINGRISTIYVEGSQSDIDALKALLEGRIDEYELKFQGGTSSPLPDVLESKRFSVGKRDGDATISCVFRVHHLPPAKNEDDVRNAVVGKFDVDYDLSDSCEYVNLIKGGNR